MRNPAPAAAPCPPVLLPDSVVGARLKPHPGDSVGIHADSTVFDDDLTAGLIINARHRDRCTWGISIKRVLYQLEYSDAWIFNKLIAQ